MAEMKGSAGLLLQITSAARDSGGFLTVSGTLKNDGAERITVPPAVRGDETEILRHGMSFGGATLVDGKNKKRYYVLRDTEGRPLTTTGFSSLKAGEALAVFIQFPSPPTKAAELTLQVPTFASATIQISG
ncbi:secreted protein [Streptomyces zinciresistens K42]|uniref:Secreted protein n=2 Tax=Streptomyces TaxID=1883 RepID=G2GI94_9ACTN|nr:secreted protein [Streptomyces zinciresistens K42]